VETLESLAARLPEGAVSTHPGEISSRSRDLWALALLRERRGEALPRAMAVVFPRSTEDVAEVLSWAQRTGTPVIPRGGGSGVSGGAQAAWRSLVLDLSQMSRVVSIDQESLAVEVEAGIRGDRLESTLGRHGLTLGHYPQSLAISSVGGWIAARSAGQASPWYGVIEDMLLGLVVVLSGGEILRLRPTPRSAAGPDLRRLFAGSEGTLGVVTEATLSVSRARAGLRWTALQPPGFVEGLALARRIAQEGPRPVVLRLYDEADAAVTFGAARHPGGPVLIAAFEEGLGGQRSVESLRQLAGSSASELPPRYGEHWWAHRFDAVDLYRRIMGEERLLGAGVVVDTLEVAGLWSQLPALYEAIRTALSGRAEAVGCHLSHPYRSGGSLYFTFLIREQDDERAEATYVACWREAARGCHSVGGTITHHHGVGVLKAPFMEEEMGAAGVSALRAVKRALDPRGILNPGKLLPPEGG
jgi:alkyldihydroxyacetonephosphate synthase